MASGSSIDSTSSAEDKRPSYSGPSPRRDGPHLPRTSEALLASWSSRFGARLGAGASGALARAHSPGSRNRTRAPHAGAAAGARRGTRRGRSATGTGAGGNAFVLQALLALRAHHAEALAARAGGAAATRHPGGTRPRSGRAARRASAAARAAVCRAGALRQRHPGKCKKRRGRSCTDELQGCLLYLLLLEPDVPELLEPLLVPEPELELPMPLLLGELELLLGEELLLLLGELELGELLDVPPLEELEPLPDLLKYASHS